MMQRLQHPLRLTRRKFIETYIATCPSSELMLSVFFDTEAPGALNTGVNRRHDDLILS